MKLEKMDQIPITVKDRAGAEARFKEMFDLEPDHRYIYEDE